jgi:hypothetical protein
MPPISPEDLTHGFLGPQGPWLLDRSATGSPGPLGPRSQTKWETKGPGTLAGLVPWPLETQAPWPIDHLDASRPCHIDNPGALITLPPIPLDTWMPRLIVAPVAKLQQGPRDQVAQVPGNPFACGAKDPRFPCRQALARTLLLLVHRPNGSLAWIGRSSSWISWSHGNHSLQGTWSTSDLALQGRQSPCCPLASWIQAAGARSNTKMATTARCLDRS